ncbi:hypothetical protein G9A89_022847 [Geosiphon pyriformis]|nr:hypothetical protein G9A89_022847 [Geosiphon pyriformis]
MNKFNSMWVFIFGLDKDFLGAKMAIIMNNSLVQHVFKIEEMSGHVISVWFLFRDKLLVTVLDLYADVSTKTRFGQCLLSAIADYEVASASDFFNTDYKAVMISVGLDGFLDFHLNGLYKQANRDYWKFKIAGVNAPK